MYKNITARGFIPAALLMVPGTSFAAYASKDQPIKEKTPIELQRGQLQPLTLV